MCILGVYIFRFNEHIYFYKCKVNNNKAEIAGGVLAINVRVSILSSVFEKNVANLDYGGLYIEGTNDMVMRNTNISKNEAKGDIDSLRFSDEHAFGSGGLAIVYSINIEIENCIFDTNHAHRYGGAFFTTFTENVILREVTMKANTALLGGGANVYRSARVSFESLRIEGCTASVNGGGFYVDESTQVEFLNSSFIRNAAETGSGSAVWITASSPRFENNFFDANEAQSG